MDDYDNFDDGSDYTDKKSWGDSTQPPSNTVQSQSQTSQPSSNIGLIGNLGNAFDNSYKSIQSNATNDFKNLQSNWGRTYDNFSKGNILHGVADTAMMLHNPTGGWGQWATDRDNKQKNPNQVGTDNTLVGRVNPNAKVAMNNNIPSFPEPKFEANHLSEPDKYGFQSLNQDGQNFLASHMMQLQTPTASNDTSSAPALPEIHAGAGSKAVGSAVGSDIASALI